MQDFKKELAGKWKKLDRSIAQTRNLIHRNKKIKVNKLFLTVTSISFIGLFILIAALLFAKTPVKADNMGVSYIGSAKIQDEFTAMSNTEAAGGNDIQAIDTNSSELKFFFYKIKQGESLTTISKKLGVTMDTLISLNSMENVHSISEGKRIIVPNLQGILYTVKKGDSIESIATSHKINTQEISEANDLEEMAIEEGNVLFLPGAQLSDEERAKAMGYLFLKPLRGHYTSGFGIRRDPFSGDMGYHPGIDIAAPLGTAVHSAKEGRVEFTGWNGGYGKCVIIKHQFGFETIYGHLSSIGVEKGAWISAGDYIGRVGSTGYSTGAHLHFEIRKYGRPTNPLRQAGLAKSGGIWY